VIHAVDIADASWVSPDSLSRKAAHFRISHAKKATRMLPLPTEFDDSRFRYAQVERTG
jgi:hypothetical protein